MNYINIPLILPFKFIQSRQKPGYHFDEGWACEQIKFFERQVFYMQKWQRADTTPLQIECSFKPQDLQVYNSSGIVVKTIPWQLKIQAINYGIYELIFDAVGLPDGAYYLYFQAHFLNDDWQFISEPIQVANTWPDTLLITYRNTKNNWGVAFSTGVTFAFRVEATITDLSVKRERETSIGQQHKVTTLSGTPYRTFKLYIGQSREQEGVWPYMLDILNRIFVCDQIKIEGRYYQSDAGSEFEITRLRGMPLIVASIDINDNIDTINLAGMELASGIVTAYNIETAFFGPAALVPVTDIEHEV